MSNLNREPTINASYQVPVHLAMRFQKRRFFKKLTNQIKELPMAAMFANGFGQNQHIYRRPSLDASCLSIGSFGQAV